MNERDMGQPKRQSPVGIAVIFVRNLRIAINIFISIFVVGYGFQASMLGFGVYSLIAVLLIGFLVLSYFQYRMFFFYVQEDKFVIEKGVFRKEKTTIPFDRIQTVHINQNIIQRVLNVVGLNIDTAGSSGRELEIAALEKSYARQLQQFLIGKKSTQEETEETDETQVEEVLNERKPLVSLGLTELLKVGITENHLRSGLVLFAVVNGYIWQYEDYILKPFRPFIEQQKDTLLAQWALMLPIGLILFVVVSVVFSLIQTVLRYYGLRFFIDAKGVQLQSGLLRKAEYQIPVNKMQYLKWKSNPLRKMFKIKTLTIKQASSDAQADKLSVKVPGCMPDQLGRVLGEFYPELEDPSDSIKPNRLLLLQLGLWLAVVPTVLILVNSYFLPLLLFFAIPFSLLSLFFINKYYRSVELEVREHVLVLKKGWVYPTQMAVKYYKLQNVRLKQNIFQKRRGLVSLVFQTAAGNESMPHIPEDVAYKIYNYCLYGVENSKRSWM